MEHCTLATWYSRVSMVSTYDTELTDYELWVITAVQHLNKVPQHHNVYCLFDKNTNSKFRVQVLLNAYFSHIINHVKESKLSYYQLGTVVQHLCSKQIKMSSGRELANSKQWLKLERRKNGIDEEYTKFFRYIHNIFLIF